MLTKSLAKRPQKVPPGAPLQAQGPRWQVGTPPSPLLHSTGPVQAWGGALSHQRLQAFGWVGLRRRRRHPVSVPGRRSSRVVLAAHQAEQGSVEVLVLVLWAQQGQTDTGGWGGGVGGWNLRRMLAMTEDRGNVELTHHLCEDARSHQVDHLSNLIDVHRPLHVQLLGQGGESTEGPSRHRPQPTDTRPPSASHQHRAALSQYNQSFRPSVPVKPVI